MRTKNSIGESTDMNSNETIIMVANMLGPAFFSLLAMGAFGSPVVAVLGELAAKAKGKIFFDKYGQQTGAMGRILLLLLLVIWGAAIAILFTRFPQLAAKVTAPGTPLLWACYASGAFLVLGVIHFSTWKAMRNAKGVHIALGLCATVASISAVTLAVPAKLIIGQPDTASFQQVFASPMAQPMAVMYTLLSISSAAALSCVYLVLRRNQDDFGRDYYNFGLKLAARWAFIPMFGFLACQGWLYAVLPDAFRTMVTGTMLGYVWLAAGILGLLCMTVWLLIARSETPLRLKGLGFLGLALMWLMHTMNATLFMNFISMY